MRAVTFILCLILCVTLASAEDYKKLPPQGVKVDAQVHASLRERVDKLQRELDRQASQSADAKSWRADVEVLIRAVRLALEQELFFKPQEPAAAFKLLAEARRRMESASGGKRGLALMGLSDRPIDQPQLLVGGFVSRIDDSVQPYGLVVPAGYDPKSTKTYRLDVWLHGRGDTKTEVPFLLERMTKTGQYTPANTFVLHPFGRHCNAFKFAGETDVYEAIDHLDPLVSIDAGRVSIRGFSMGGAGCWHLAVHDPSRWFAANPGAGFVDTIQYQGWDQGGFPYPLSETRQRLMNWYDILPWVNNLRNTNTVAYSGEVDKQKQAADRVLQASRESGFEWPYVIGKGMGHKIDPDSAVKVDAQLASWAALPPVMPRTEIDFTTHTLRYSSVGWLQITGLAKHWTPGRVRASITGDDTIEMTTDGVTRMMIDFRDSNWPRKPVNAKLRIDGQSLLVEDWDVAPGIQCELARDEDWQVVERIDKGMRKKPGLQGPIDDAFCDRFVFVLPSRPAKHGQVHRWIDRELQYAQDRWRRLMRGQVNVVLDTDVTKEQIENCHLICFGDFTSNRYLASVSRQLPIEWTSDQLRVGDQTFAPNTHAAVFCYPNPTNPNRYLVANSGMTFREFSNVSNSRQIPMLPDWAVLDVRSKDDGIFAGGIVADGFFNERWELGD
jgi:hypothetical protein